MASDVTVAKRLRGEVRCSRGGRATLHSLVACRRGALDGRLSGTRLDSAAALYSPRRRQGLSDPEKRPMPTAQELTIKELAERRPGQVFELLPEATRSESLWRRNWAAVTRVLLRK